MKFTLTFDGELPPSANGSKKTAKKWEIRKHFDPQLKELWRTHAALKFLDDFSVMNPEGGWLIQRHHSSEYPKPVIKRVATEKEIDLCAPLMIGNRTFIPVVRNTFATVAALKIHFLRNGPAGKVYQGGDIDGRIKTLLDALSAPTGPEQIIEEPYEDDPIHVLLENDSLISSISVETGSLLAQNNHNEKYVRLTIDVDVRVTDARFYNAAFLGD